MMPRSPRVAASAEKIDGLVAKLNDKDAAVRSKGEDGAKLERDIVTTVAGQARRRIRTTMAEIDDNEDESRAADLARYEEVPAHIAQGVVQEAQREAEAVKA